MEAIYTQQGKSIYSIGPNIRIPFIRKSALSGHEILVLIFYELRHRIKIISPKKLRIGGKIANRQVKQIALASSPGFY